MQRPFLYPDSMKKYLALAALLLGSALAQVAPLGLGVEEGVHVLAFVAADCSGCEALKALEDLPILFVGPEPSLPYTPYKQDTDGNLIARTFYVYGQIPTVVVLRDGQQVKRFTGAVDVGAVRTAFEMAEEGTLSPRFNLNIRVGERVEGQFADYTGLVIFWKQDCIWCERIEPDVTAICEAGDLPVRVLAVTLKEWPEACEGMYESHTYEAWGIPGAPVHVYLEEGKVIWIDLGYREDLQQIARILAARR
jgi:thiol-disulfide isomerase/thioredoxin